MLVSSFVNSFNLSGSDSLVKRARALLYRKQVLFFHVPKCGGTSLSHYFRVKYAASQFRLREETSGNVVPPQDLERWMDFKRDLFLYHALNGTSFVQGHVAYSERFANLHGKATFITMLREPTDRVVSIYFFDPRCRTMSFGEFLDSPRGRLETSVLSRFFGGLPFEADEVHESHRDAAKEALAKFDVVGVLEEPQAFQRQLKRKLGIYLDMPKRNVGKNRSEADNPQIAEYKDRLTDLCRFDIEIYDAMKRRALAEAAL